MHWVSMRRAAWAEGTEMALLDVRDLQVAYRDPSSSDLTMAVDGVSFTVEPG